VIHQHNKTELARAWKEDEADAPHKRSATILSSTGAAAEAYRSLRANLLYAFADELVKVIVLTSAGRGEGSSTICANLGIALAQAIKNTLIVDCDFHQPALHNIFGLRNLRGVTDVLVGKQSLQEVYQEPVPRLKVVCTGALLPDMEEVLGERRFTEFLDQARREFDYVLVDTPPIGEISDSLIFAHHSDGVLLVLDAQKTGKESIRQSMRRLDAVGAKVLGTVANNAKA
jgi:receptor protein-tyrosine kinase